MLDVSPERTGPLSWKILIADDDADVHAATRMALRGVSFRGRTLEFVDAYSGAQTLEVLRAHPDTALIFLDVIMETDDAGLRAAKCIRDSGFNLVRIIVRTGFPGQAPERQVIVDHDIHDYKEKTGLSLQKMFTSVISALRAYDDMVALEDHRLGLMRVLESVSWFDFNAVGRYVASMLAEFSTLTRLGSHGIVMVYRTSANSRDLPTVIATLGGEGLPDEPSGLDDLPVEMAAQIRKSLDQGLALSTDSGQTLFSRNHGIDLVVFATGADALEQADEVLLDVFLMAVCQAISNQRIFSGMESERNVVLRGLALHAERWNTQATEELDCLARLSTAIAQRLHTTLSFPQEVDSCFIRDIGVAVMLHDLGNDALPVDLLKQSTRYDPQDKIVMQQHVAAGVQAVDAYLADSSGPQTTALHLAREIIGGHHEHLDGSGYPHGLQGETIPLSARLAAVADAYVAMTSPRPHRSAMDALTACTLIRQGAGSRFDPSIVQAFLDVVANGLGK